MKKKLKICFPAKESTGSSDGQRAFHLRQSCLSALFQSVIHLHHLYGTVIGCQYFNKKLPQNSLSAVINLQAPGKGCLWKEWARN